MMLKRKHKEVTNQILIKFICLKDPYEAKYQLLINKRKIKYCEDSNAFIEYSNDMNDIYINIEKQNPGKERKILNVFNMIPDMLSLKKLSPIVTELHLLFLLHSPFVLYRKILD